MVRITNLKQLTTYVLWLTHSIYNYCGLMWSFGVQPLNGYKSFIQTLTPGFMIWKFRKKSRAVNKMWFSNCGLHVGVRIPHQRQQLHHDVPLTAGFWEGGYKTLGYMKAGNSLIIWMLSKFVLRGELTNGPSDDVLKERLVRSMRSQHNICNETSSRSESETLQRLMQYEKRFWLRVRTTRSTSKPHICCSFGQSWDLPPFCIKLYRSELQCSWN